MLKKITFWTTIFLFSAIGLSPMSQDQANISISGDWNFSISLGGREIKAIMTITQEGENIKVLIKNSGGAERGGTGFVKGTEIEWTEINKNAGQEIIYKGKLEGDVINGYSYPKNNEAGRLDWKAVRKAKGFGG